MDHLRQQLVEITLAWEKAFGNAPLITTVISEYDAARLVGCSVDAYSSVMQGCSVVQKGHDFVFNGSRYQVKGNRPSGKSGSAVSWVPKATNYDWDYLVWILYNSQFEIQEAWEWPVADYRAAFDSISRLSPAHMQRGRRLA